MECQKRILKRGFTCETGVRDSAKGSSGGSFLATSFNFSRTNDFLCFLALGLSAGGVSTLRGLRVNLVAFNSFQSRFFL